MASSLIEHKRINTTVAKAKALKRYVEPLITKSKNDTTHSRRVVFSYLKNKYAVAELFRDVAVKVASRPGGYTRIIKTGNRLGDNAEMCMIELVDYNELYTTDKAKKKSKSTRRSGSRKKAAETVEATPAPEAAKEAEVKVEAPETTEAKTPEIAAEKAPEVKAAEAGSEEKPEETTDKKDDKAGDDAAAKTE